MRKSSSILLVTALFLGLAALAVAPAQANIWCMQCANDPNDCFACCKCDGFTTYYCAEIACGAPVSVLTEAPFDLSMDQSEACVTEQEAETEAASVEETPANDEAVKEEAEKTEETTETTTQ